MVSILYKGKTSIEDGTGSDPNDKFVRLLHHFDTTIDDDEVGFKPVAVGTASISDIRSKFGVKSLSLNGGRIDYPCSYHFGFPGNFTIECWAYFNSMAVNDRVYSFVGRHTDVNNFFFFGIYYLSPDYYIIGQLRSGSTYFINSGGIISNPIGSWNHYAISRSGTDVKYFVNGTVVATQSVTVGSLPPGGISIGATPGYSAPGSFNGYIDEIAIYSDWAKYTSEFTAPSSPILYFGA